MAIAGKERRTNSMRTFPAEVGFCKEWRSYQARVLSELEGHLGDNHLHVIAAPGSGKTVLGLEVVRRLGRPCVIFAPTIAIRDQWVERFVQLFCQEGMDVDGLISKDVRRPGVLTVSTYQGLHSAYTGGAEREEPEEEDGQERPGRVRAKKAERERLIARLKEAEVGVMVLDEAHHLRSEWWKCLIDVKRGLGEPTVVALTATPPYDVPPVEWERYNEMCGPVDAEISVPELVRERNLCPHQDYVFMSTPTMREQGRIKEFRERVRGAVQAICASDDFARALKGHSCVRRPDENVEKILEDPGFFSSVAIFLHQVEGRAPRRLLRVLGVAKRRIPRLSLEWMEVLLTGCLYGHREEFAERDEMFESLWRGLSRAGAIERRQVMLRSNDEIRKLLVTSVSKLESISEIVRLEAGALGERLRLVVLTDFIRKADLPKSADDVEPLTRIGVVPIFEQIRRRNIEGIRLGILSGTFVVVPKECMEIVEQAGAEMGIEAGAIRFSPLRHDERFLEVDVGGQDRQKVVQLVTRVFRRGGITVLVGTKSLLGEGWDAPSINVLVLASFVGSYMLSNQMRGRAIRTEEGNPEKTANIWHLVCVEPGKKELSDDAEMLTRRFRAFVGVAHDAAAITSGIERLGIGEPPFSRADVEEIDGRMRQMALDRGRLRNAWEDALASGEIGEVVDEATGQVSALPRAFVFWNTIKAVLWQACFAGTAGYSWMMRSGEEAMKRSETLGETLTIVMVAAMVGTVCMLPFCLKALWLFVRHGPVASSMREIGKALVRAMHQAEVIETRVSKLRVKAQKGKEGEVLCRLEGGTTYEKSLFVGAMQEILGAIENPRYLLIRRSRLLGLIRRDYHSVPAVLAKNKANAAYFVQMWEKYVGAADLVYTRSVEGRQMLLKARGHSMSAKFVRRSDRRKVWK